MIDREPHLGSHCDLARGGFRCKSFPQFFLSNVFSIDNRICSRTCMDERKGHESRGQVTSFGLDMT